MPASNSLATGLKLVLKPDQRLRRLLLQPIMQEKCFFQRLPLGHGGASGRAVMPTTSPGNIHHGSSPSSFSTGTQLDSKPQDSRQQEVQGEGKPISQPNSATPANLEDQAKSTSRYVFTFNSIKCNFTHSRSIKAFPTKLGTCNP